MNINRLNSSIEAVSLPSGGSDLPFERIMKHKENLERLDRIREITKKTSKQKEKFLTESLREKARFEIGFEEEWLLALCHLQFESQNHSKQGI